MHLRMERMVTHVNTQKYPVEERIGGWVIEPVLHPDGRVTLFKVDQQIGIYSNDDDDDVACAMGYQMIDHVLSDDLPDWANVRKEVTCVDGIVHGVCEIEDLLIN